jgi:hypothetical protein
MIKLTEVFRESVIGYLTTKHDLQLEHFNKLVDICTSNTTHLWLPARTVGIGIKGEKSVKDTPIRDLAEEFVLECLLAWAKKTPNTIKKAAQKGTFDFIPNTFKQRVINKIRDVVRSHEEDFVEMLPEDYQDDEIDC